MITALEIQKLGEKRIKDYFNEDYQKHLRCIESLIKENAHRGVLFYYGEYKHPLIAENMTVSAYVCSLAKALTEELERNGYQVNKTSGGNSVRLYLEISWKTKNE